MSEDLTNGTFTGRFYRFITGVDQKVALENAKKLSWVLPKRPTAFLRGFCQGSPPHGGDILEDAMELAYEEGRVMRMFIREEERSANRNTVKIEADRISRERFGHPLQEIPKGNRKELEDEAKESLIARSTPKTKVKTLVLTESFIWVSGRQPSTGEETFLVRVFGDVVSDTSMVFGRAGPKQALLALVLEATDKEGMAAPDIKVIDATVKNKTMRCRGEETGVLKAMLKTGAVEVERVELEVDLGHSRVVLAIDEQGVLKADPAPSMGGIYPDRILRRFEEVKAATLRVKTVIETLVDGAK
jgi:hypothetical protein